MLVDCGTRPRQRLSRLGPPDLDIALAGDLDAVVITHAHNDHAGYVPALVARYPTLDVLATADTAALLPTMWNDSVKFFERATREYPEPGEVADKPPYRTTQVLAAIDRIRAIAFGHAVEVADGVTIELFPAGHILGAAGVVVTAGAISRHCYRRRIDPSPESAVSVRSRPARSCSPQRSARHRIHLLPPRRLTQDS